MCYLSKDELTLHILQMVRITKITFLICGLLVVLSCSTESEVEEPDPEFHLSLDPRLERMSENLYRLNLDRSRLQSVHRVQGRLTQDGNPPDLPQKYIGWESSHSWVLTDTLGFIIRRTINANGEWTNLDTLFVTGFGGFEVPTVNRTSVTREDGTFSGMIAPILPMEGDTMVVKAQYKEGSIHVWETVSIYLD